MKRIKMDDIFEDDLEYKVGPTSQYNIWYGDIFYFWYQGINVFFFVCRHTKDQVCLYELAKRKAKINGETVEFLCGLKPTRSPNVITHNNCERKSTFWVNVKDENHILIPIDKNMPIYKKAEHPLIGDFEACKLVEETKTSVLNYYWKIIKI